MFGWIWPGVEVTQNRYAKNGLSQIPPCAVVMKFEGNRDRERDIWANRNLIQIPMWVLEIWHNAYIRTKTFLVLDSKDPEQYGKIHDLIYNGREFPLVCRSVASYKGWVQWLRT